MMELRTRAPKWRTSAQRDRKKQVQNEKPPLSTPTGPGLFSFSYSPGLMTGVLSSSEASILTGSRTGLTRKAGPSRNWLSTSQVTWSDTNLERQTKDTQSELQRGPRLRPRRNSSSSDPSQKPSYVLCHPLLFTKSTSIRYAFTFHMSCSSYPRCDWI